MSTWDKVKSAGETAWRVKGWISIAVLVVFGLTSLGFYLYFKTIPPPANLTIKQAFQSKPEDPAIDIVFIHGLDGHWRDTWQSTRSGTPFWPEMLGQEVKSANVWSVGYDAASSGWQSEPLSIQDRADNVLDLLALHGIGERPIVFVTHSLGGLVTKNVLRRASDRRDANPQWGKILDQTEVVVFFGTPHSGSDLTGVVNLLGKAGFNYRPTGLVQEMKDNSVALRGLNDWYKGYAPSHQIQTVVFREQKPTKGVIVVDAGQSDPGITDVQARFVEDTHIGMCKLDGSENAYGLTKQEIERLLAQVGAGAQGPWEKLDMGMLAKRQRQFAPDDFTALQNFLQTPDSPIDAQLRREITTARKANMYPLPIADRIVFVSPRLNRAVHELEFDVPHPDEAICCVWVVSCDRNGGVQLISRRHDLRNSATLRLDRPEGGIVRCLLFVFPLSKNAHEKLDTTELRHAPKILN